jgi:hypothetical protein
MTALESCPRQWPDPQLEARMLRDADLLAGFCSLPSQDVACHVRALLDRVHQLQMEVDRLTPFYDAIASMAAQFVCPKTTPEQLMAQILKGDQ